MNVLINASETLQKICDHVLSYSMPHSLCSKSASLNNLEVK
jgi:hypothetical protein